MKIWSVSLIKMQIKFTLNDFFDPLDWQKKNFKSLTIPSIGEAKETGT